MKINEIERKYIIKNYAKLLKKHIKENINVYNSIDFLIESATGYYMFKGYHGKVARQKALRLLNI